MGSLTETLPKPLIKICGKPILDHIVSALPEVIDELIVVVGYRQEQIREYCSGEFIQRKVTYVEQKNFAGGTGDALMCAKDAVKGKFLILNGDDIYGAPALEKIVLKEHALFGVQSDTPELFGVLVLNEDGTLKEIIEKPKNPNSNLVNIGGYVVNDSIFKYKIPISDSGELYATDFITAYAQDNQVEIVEQDTWLPIGYPEHIEAAEQILSEKK